MDSELIKGKKPIKNDEYIIYFTKNLYKEKEDILLSWKNNSSRFPILSSSAGRYLNISASSVTMEAISSTATNIITLARNKLSENTIKDLILLKGLNKYNLFKWENELIKVENIIGSD